MPGCRLCPSFTWITSSSSRPSRRWVIYPALTEKETETQRCYVSCPRSHSLSGVEARIPAQVCLPPVGSLCCQKVLKVLPLEKQVWGGGFQSELIRLPRGESIVICPPPPHPSAKQVAGEPPAKAPAPAPGASPALLGSLPLPGAPKVALRSPHTPMPSNLHFQIAECKGTSRKREEVT